MSQCHRAVYFQFTTLNATNKHQDVAHFKSEDEHDSIRNGSPFWLFIPDNYYESTITKERTTSSTFATK
jgi:hypothetical protein